MELTVSLRYKYMYTKFTDAFLVRKTVNDVGYTWKAQPIRSSQDSVALLLIVKGNVLEEGLSNNTLPIRKLGG